MTPIAGSMPKGPPSDMLGTFDSSSNLQRKPFNPVFDGPAQLMPADAPDRGSPCDYSLFLILFPSLRGKFATLRRGLLWAYFFCRRGGGDVGEEDPKAIEHFPTLTEEELSNQSRVIELVHTLPPLFQFGTTTVVRVSRDTVIKRIGGSSQTEALSLRYVRDHTTILVPQVKNFFAHPTVGSYVTMDYIEGQTLSQCWRHIGLLHKLQIAWKLRGYIHQLRRLRRSIPGPIDNSYCTGRFFTENGAGPFETEGDMIDWFNHKLDIAKARKDAPETTAQFEVGEWPLVFTHQDLCRRNIMLARNGDVYIIDWTTAGFYPEWLEYPCMAWYIDEPWLWRAVLIPIIIGFGYSPYRRRLSYMGWALTFGYFM